MKFREVDSKTVIGSTLAGGSITAVGLYGVFRNQRRLLENGTTEQKIRVLKRLETVPMFLNLFKKGDLFVNIVKNDESEECRARALRLIATYDAGNLPKAVDFLDSDNNKYQSTMNWLEEDESDVSRETIYRVKEILQAGSGLGRRLSPVPEEPTSDGPPTPRRLSFLRW